MVSRLTNAGNSTLGGQCSKLVRIGGWRDVLEQCYACFFRAIFHVYRLRLWLCRIRFQSNHAFHIGAWPTKHGCSASWFGKLVTLRFVCAHRLWRDTRPTWSWPRQAGLGSWRRLVPSSFQMYVGFDRKSVWCCPGRRPCFIPCVIVAVAAAPAVGTAAAVAVVTGGDGCVWG